MQRAFGLDFIDAHPPDTTIVPLTRTVGQDRLVDELIYQFTHTVEMPWMLPGIAPTGTSCGGGGWG